MTKHVAIQGIAGSYHDIAARSFFANETITIVDCSTFRHVVSTVQNKPGMFGLLAIENTIAGSILPNHELIRESGLFVTGEYKLRISHCLAALPGTNIDDLQEIGSHPMALMQCRDFLDTLPPSITITEKEDTATSARWIALNKAENHAAICGSQAAKIYGLDILAEAIETNSNNFTRFLLVADLETAKKFYDETKRKPNKASLVFVTSHTVGSLSAVLTILSFYGVNLTKIQSFPRLGMAWQYFFYVDCIFSDYERYKQSLNAIRPLTSELNILGEYEANE